MSTHQMAQDQRRTEIGMRLRGIAASAVLVSAAVHLMLWDQGYDGIAVIGPLFLLNAAGGLVIGLAVLSWRHWLPLLGAMGFGALSLVALLWSAAFGLFGVSEPLNGVPQLISIVAEAAAVVLGAAAIRAEQASWLPGAHSAGEPWPSDVPS
jgi:hypothetical protein